MDSQVFGSSLSLFIFTKYQVKFLYCQSHYKELMPDEPKHTHHRINTLIIDLNRISVINNNRHTNFAVTSWDNLRMLSVKHLLKEDLRYLLSLIYGTMKIPRWKCKLKLYSKLRFVFLFPCLYYLYLFDENIFICRQRYITLRKNMFLKYINRQLGKMWEN